jgi:cytochrome c
MRSGSRERTTPMRLGVRETRVPGAWLRIVALAAAFAVAGACRDQPPSRIAQGDVKRGAELIRAYGCQSCHIVPGVPGADGLVGPPLIHWSRRVYLAGHVPNTPDNLVRWIMNPQEVHEHTAMPDMGVTRTDAQHIAAYLFSLD